MVLLSIPTCLAIAALAADFGHAVLVRAQLQTACDAAALAGAADLIGQEGPLTQSLISTVQTDAIALGQSNYADNRPVSVEVNSPGPTYNAPPYTATNPQYTVVATATAPVNNIFARLFGMSTTPVSATSRAGVFPTSTATTAFGNLDSITAPITVALDVNANNDINLGVSLEQVRKGQGWELRTDGATGGGAKDSSWIELEQFRSASPVSPLAGGQVLSTQFASAQNPGITTDPNGVPYLFVSGGGNNSSTSGSTGWTQYIYNQIVANGGSYNLTVPLITVPNGNSDANSMNQNSKLEIVGVATFNITRTCKGPGPNLVGDATFYGTLVNAMPLTSANLAQFSNFFSQFQGGNSNGSGGSSGGTPQIRLF